MNTSQAQSNLSLTQEALINWQNKTYSNLDHSRSIINNKRLNVLSISHLLKPVSRMGRLCLGGKITKPKKRICNN